MECSFACRSPEQLIARRQFLGGMALGAGTLVGGLGVLVRPAIAEQLAKNQKRLLIFYMAGGLSQLESWEPKPGTDTGGTLPPIPPPPAAAPHPRPPPLTATPHRHPAA